MNDIPIGLGVALSFVVAGLVLTLTGAVDLIEYFFLRQGWLQRPLPRGATNFIAGGIVAGIAFITMGVIWPWKGA